MRFPGPPHWCELRLKIYARDHLWLPFLRDRFFLFHFPPLFCSAWNPTLFKFPACGLWLRRWIYLLQSFSLMCLSHIWFLQSDGVWTLTYLLHASSSHLNCNSILSGSADVLREKAALWLFTFLDIYFSSRVCLGISSSLSFEFFDVCKKMILTIKVGMNKLTFHFWNWRL